MVIPDEVDIIVCGGGSCGCVVAGRLANLDHNLQVLLIEGGENNLNNPVGHTNRERGYPALTLSFINSGCSVQVSTLGT